MAESITLLSAAMSLANLLYLAKRSRAQSKAKVIESFESELKDFVYNVLGWYNQIIEYSYSLLPEIEHGRLSAEKEREYSKLLETIRRSDVYYSKCEHFVYKGLKRYEQKAFLKSPQVRASIRQLVDSYKQFSKRVLSHKDKLGALLWYWKEMTSSKRRTEVRRIREDLEKIEANKNAVVQVLDIELEL